MRAPRFLVLCTSVLGTLAAIVHYPVLFAGKTWSDQDHLLFTLPSRDFLSRALRAGHFPAWWDRVGLGVPFAADPNNGVFYPPAWLVGILPWDYGADVLLLLHLVWGALGVAYLSRRLGATDLGGVVAGVAFMTSGCVASLIVNSIPLLTVAWMPWVALMADRVATAQSGSERGKAAICLAATVAGQILSGCPGGMLTSGLLAVALVFIRAPRRLPAFALMTAGYIGGALLAGPLVVPALHALSSSQRAGGLSFEDGAMWSLHPLRLLESTWLYLLGAPRGGASLAEALAGEEMIGKSPNWIMSVHIGLPVVVLAVRSAWRRSSASRALWVVAALFVIIALGKYTPLYGVYRAIFLPEQFIRYPERHFLAVVVIVCTLAGLGWTHSFGDKSGVRPALITGALGLLVVAASLALGALRGDAERVIVGAGGNLVAQMDVAAGIDISVAGGLVSGVTTVLLAIAFLAHLRPSLKRFSTGLGLGVVFVVGMACQTTLLASVPRNLITPVADILRPVPQPTAPLAGRIYGPQLIMGLRGTAEQTAIAQREHARANMPALHGWASLPGFAPILPQALRSFWYALAQQDGRRVLDLLGIGLVLAPSQQPVGEKMRPLAHSPFGLTLYQNLAARPRAFATSNVTWSAATSPEALARSGGLTVDRINLPVTARGDGDLVAAQSSFFHPCAIHGDRLESIDVICEAGHDGYAVMLDAGGEGWTATVDDRATKIVMADGLFRAVKLPAGRHVVRFRYRTPGLSLGIALGVLTAIALISAWRNLSQRMPTRHRIEGQMEVLP